MKILAINGSHRVGENTSKLLQMALDEAAALGAETEMVDLAELDMSFAQVVTNASLNQCAQSATTWTS